MTTPAMILQALIIIGFPWVAQQFSKRKATPTWLSPIIMCYGLGIILGNLPILPLYDPLSTQATELSIVFAIPLLLFSTNVVQQLRFAPKALLAFGLCVISGMLGTAIMAFSFHAAIPATWQLSGMLTGMYTGGTPNMQAIGLALGAAQETIVLVNAADIFWGGLYLIFLTSIAHRTFGGFLPNFVEVAAVQAATTEPVLAPRLVDVFKGISLAVLVTSLAVGLTLLLFGNLQRTTFLMLALTTLSLVASLHPKVKRWIGTFETGEYFLLIFCVALGMLADFREMIDHGGPILLYAGGALLLTILFHLFFCYLFRIDRDTVMITATAALYGPVFVGQIASAIGNRALVFTGIAIGLLGFAIGNYLGIGWAYFIGWLW